MSEPVCLIKCDHCKRQFRSPIQFGRSEAFFTSALVGNQVQCCECRKMTRCNKENMYFNARDGTVFHGTETTPE
jgi:hypothetical protein